MTDFGCHDGSCPFTSRLGVHTNGGCCCVADRFPDDEQRRLVNAMLVAARAAAAADVERRAKRVIADNERKARIAECRAELGRETDREVLERRKELRAEIKRLEEEGFR